MADLDRHWFEIECRIEDPADPSNGSRSRVDPGQLLLREFRASRRERRGEERASEKLAVEKVDSGTWFVRGARRTLKVTITVYALDQSVRGAYLDRHRGYFNGPCVFVLPEGRDVGADRGHDRAAAAFDSLRGLARARRRSSAARSTSAASASIARRTTTSCSIIRSRSATFESVEFEAAGVPHHLVVAGRFESDLERVAADLKQICTAQIEFFGRPAPFDRYWFL